MSVIVRRPTARPTKTVALMLVGHFLWWVAVPMLFRVAGAVDKLRRRKAAAVGAAEREV